MLLMGAHRGRVSRGSWLNQPGVHHPSSGQKSAGGLLSAPLYPTALLPRFRHTDTSSSTPLPGCHPGGSGRTPHRC